MRQILIICMALVLTQNACKRKDDKLNLLTAELNGSQWNGKVRVTDNGQSFNLESRIERSNGDRQMQFTLFNISKVEGRQNIFKWDMNLSGQFDLYSVFLTYGLDGDIICDAYNNTGNSDSANNYIEIVRQQDNFKEIWGKFRSTHYRFNSCSVSTLPDTVVIDKGDFHIYL